MLKKVNFLVFVLLSSVLLSACSKYTQVLKSTDTEEKYAAALVYYEEEEYFKAMTLFEELLTLYKGTIKAEGVYYYFAYCHYGTSDYMLAAYHFKNYVKSFPKAEHAEECQYMMAFCHYKQSPIPSLDQASTHRAIGELQLFINKFPESERVKKCNDLIDELRRKLQLKSFDNARLYHKTGDHKSAVIALKNTLETYPGSTFEEETLFLIFKSSYLYATLSVEAKQEERFDDALKEYKVFIAKFPNGQFSKDAADMKKQIDKIKSAEKAG